LQLQEQVFSARRSWQKHILKTEQKTHRECPFQRGLRPGDILVEKRHAQRIHQRFPPDRLAAFFGAAKQTKKRQQRQKSVRRQVCFRSAFQQVRG